MRLKLEPAELKEIQDIVEQRKAIDRIIDTLVQRQIEIDNRERAWTNAIAWKHKIPDGIQVDIDFTTGELTLRNPKA